MKARYLIVAFAVLVAFCVSKRVGAVGGPADPSVGGPGTPVEASATASVTGTVKVVGVLPKPTPINMAQEPACAKNHPGQMTSGEVVTGENGTLGNVIVYVSGGLEGRTFEAPGKPAMMDQKGCMYSPHVLALQANQKIEVVNSDPTSHNIHPIPANNREWNKSQPPGTPPVEASFAREEVSIPIKCNVHPWMRSYIAVFKHPYYAVTAKEGTFELKNLPPGTYTLTAWHEKFGTTEQKITVGPNETKKLDFVFKSKGY